MAKAKAKALTRVPQDREGAVWTTGRIGTLRREIAAKKATADEAVKEIGQQLEADTADLLTELAEHEAGLQSWCEANRDRLTTDGRVKYHDFGTGRISWRLRPPKVAVRSIETVIEACKALGLNRFLREKVELNREAMLADPDTARRISGVSISSAGEDFIIEPAELQTAEAA